MSSLNLNRGEEDVTKLDKLTNFVSNWWNIRNSSYISTYIFNNLAYEYCLTYRFAYQSIKILYLFINKL